MKRHQSPGPRVFNQNRIAYSLLFLVVALVSTSSAQTVRNADILESFSTSGLSSILTTRSGASFGSAGGGVSSGINDLGSTAYGDTNDPFAGSGSSEGRRGSSLGTGAIYKMGSTTATNARGGAMAHGGITSEQLRRARELQLSGTTRARVLNELRTSVPTMSSRNTMSALPPSPASAEESASFGESSTGASVFEQIGAGSEGSSFEKLCSFDCGAGAVGSSTASRDSGVSGGVGRANRSRFGSIRGSGLSGGSVLDELKSPSRVPGR